MFDGRRCEGCGDEIDVLENPGRPYHTECEPHDLGGEGG